MELDGLDQEQWTSEVLRDHVEPVRTQNISTHWLRHTTLNAGTPTGLFDSDSR